MDRTKLKGLSFFRKPNGGVDQIAMSVYCFESAVYNIMKNNDSIDVKLVKPLFIRNIQPTFWYNDETGIFRINNESISLNSIWRNYVNINKYVKMQDKNSIKFLESLLNEGKMVILQSVFERMKFYEKYDPEFNFNDYFQGEANHANIVVAHDKDNFYFVDKLPYCVNDNFVPYEENKSIGVTSKSDVIDSLSYFMRCYTLDIDVEKLNDKDATNNSIISFLREMAESYSGTSVSRHGYTLYDGILAWEKLIEFCEKGADLKKYFQTPGWSMHDRICFDIWMIHGSRVILLEYLIQLRANSKYPSNYTELINTIAKSTNKLRRLETAIAKRMISRISLLDNKIADRVKEIVELENKTNELLKNLINNQM